MRGYEQRRQRGWPYWKVQWYDTRSATWRDVQHGYSIRDEAVAAAHGTRAHRHAEVRLMRINRDGRSPEAL